MNGRLGRGLLWLYFLLFVAFLFFPLVVLVIFAFNSGTTPTFPLAGFSTKWFSTAFANTDLTDALKRSALIGIIASAVATGLGIMASVGLAAKSMRFRTVAVGLLLLPLVVPYISLAVGLLILLQALKLSPAVWAIILGHVVIALPFAILVVLPRLRSLDPSLNEAARDLGASNWSAFRLITLPLLGPALVSSFLICFITSFDEFAIASFLYPSGQPTYPVFLYASSRSAAQLPQVIAVGTLVIALSILVIVLAEGGRRWGERRLEGRDSADAEGPTDADVPPLLLDQPVPAS
jgi:spermidine/putrescine transport system permease protein